MAAEKPKGVESGYRRPHSGRPWVLSVMVCPLPSAWCSGQRTSPVPSTLHVAPLHRTAGLPPALRPP